MYIDTLITLAGKYYKILCVYNYTIIALSRCNILQETGAFASNKKGDLNETILTEAYY